MESLKQRIRREGKNLGNGILKVDSFLNHQVDPAFMLAVGGALAAHFGAANITKVLTAEISGIAPALTTALALGVSVVYARKTKPITMPENAYVQDAPSHTKGKIARIMVSPEFLHADDTVLIIDAEHPDVSLIQRHSDQTDDDTPASPDASEDHAEAYPDDEYASKYADGYNG